MNDWVNREDAFWVLIVLGIACAIWQLWHFAWSVASARRAPVNQTVGMLPGMLAVAFFVGAVLIR